MQRFLPQPTTVSRPFWDGCRQGELRLQQCRACGRFVFYPTYACNHCGARELAWKVASGRGRVYAATVVEHRPGEADVDGPLIVALVALDEGPVMMSNIRTDTPYAVAIGDAVTVRFDDVSGEISMPFFVPESS